MKNKHRRLYFVLFLLVMVGLALGLVLYGLRDGISYFYTPSDVVSGKHLNRPLFSANGIDSNKPEVFRLGGVVKKNSVKKNTQGLAFVVTDFNHEVGVVYQGLVPNLFRENSGVIATGYMTKNADNQNIFFANDILAKHDENYMPKELTKALKDKGEWRE